MDQKDTSERPPDSDFQQQNLKAWQPLLTPKWVIGTFFLIGLVFVPIGIAILHESEKVSTVEVAYEDNTAPSFMLTMDIEKDMEPPVYFYYKLRNFYQNHRRYVKSRSDPQLRGESPSSLDSCEPLEMNEGKALYPCGLIAGSYFNDKFLEPTVLTAEGSSSPLEWTDKGIAWTSDRTVKFKFGPSHFNNATMTRNTPFLTTPLPEEPTEDFIVWMRTAGLPTFKKLRYIINTKLAAGSKLQIKVENNFNVTSFNGAKAAFLSTTSALGGKNTFLGLMYIIVGSLCLLLSLVFLIKHCVSPRQVGDMAYFNWSGGPRAAN